MQLKRKVDRFSWEYLRRKSKYYFPYLTAYPEWFFNHRKNLECFKNKHAGEKCFIIGNGPSLNKMDLSLLNDCYTFGLNKIYLLLEKSGLEISYHVAVNDLVIEQSVNEFESLPCPSFLSYVPSRKLVRELPHLNFLLTGPLGDFKGDVARLINEGATVTYVAMQLAFYMGFEEIYLIGVDHNFKTKGNPNEKQRLVGEDVNHFDPNYFKGKDWHLPDLEASEASYTQAKSFYEKAGRRIFDATIDGKLDVFEKVEFEVALQKCKRCRRSSAV